MQMRQDVRPPGARRRRYATGTRAVWWPENASWNMVQWLPREEATEAMGQQAMAEKPVLQTGLSRECNMTEMFYPEEQKPQGKGEWMTARRSDLVQRQGRPQWSGTKAKAKSPRG